MIKYFCLKSNLVIIPIILIFLGSSLKATANCDHNFNPYLEQIRESLPLGLWMRLPSKIPNNHINYDIQVISNSNIPNLTIKLFTCKSQEEQCLAGSFTVDSTDNISAQEALQKHIVGAAPITLAEKIQGYFLESSQYSSVMWEQDNLIYTVNFLTSERQNILYMANSMVNSQPIYSVVNSNYKFYELQIFNFPISKTLSEEFYWSINTNQLIPLSANSLNKNTENLTEIDKSCLQDNNKENQQCCLIPRQKQDTNEPILINILDEEIQIKDNLIAQIKIKNSTVFNYYYLALKIQEIIQKYKKNNLNLEKKEDLFDAIEKGINQLYIEHNYWTSKVHDIILKNDILEIDIIEGNIYKIIVKNRERVNLDYICSRIKLGVNSPLNLKKLEEQLKLLREDPLFDNVEAKLVETGSLGQSNLEVIVSEANSFKANLSFDNYSPSSVGSERFGLNLSFDNLTGLGDKIAASYYPTITGGAHLLNLTYQVPINAMNGTILFRALPNWSKVTESPFDQLDIRAQKEQYEIFYHQPLVRSLREEFSISFGFSYQHGQTFIFDRFPTPFGFGPDEEGNSSTSVINFSQDYVKRDTQGAWAFRSQFNFGTGLFDATTNDEPIPDGHFFSWLGQVQRVQQLGDDHLLIIQGDIQLTSDSLLPAHQFVIGGGQSVRGYRQNARSGDNGFRFSVEDRITLVRDAKGDAKLQIAPFIDMGSVWNNLNNPNQLNSDNFLISGGLGILLQPIPDLLFRLDYGLPLIDLEDRGNNIQDNGWYFFVQYQLNK